jgi:hypothetical protein
MSRAETPTLLSIDRFAKIFGINPVHFCGAGGTDIFPLKGSCSDVWYQHSYIASDRVAREDLARAIANAEEDIAAYLGYWPAPKWFSKEMHMYPRHHRPDIFDFGENVRGDPKSLKTTWGRIISPGRRHVDYVGQASVGAGTMVWSDPDADGFDERVTITVPTTLTSLSRQQIKVYFDGHSTSEWEIRDPRTVVIGGGFVVATFDFWQFINPALQDPYPTGSPTALNITGAIYIDTADVYREFTDHTQYSVEFFWEPRCAPLACPSCGGVGCTVCQLTVQCGCMYIRDVMLGIVVPQPGDWSTVDLKWGGKAYSLCTPPDQVKLWYYAGEMSPGFLAGNDLDPLSRWFAEAIAWIAVARLERNFCTCSGLASVQNELRAEMSRTDDGGPSWFLNDRDGLNPFGTKVGEVKAWRRLSKLADRIAHVAVV